VPHAASAAAWSALPWTLIVCEADQPPNAPLPTDETLEGMVTLVKPVHAPNARSPMDVRPDGILIFVRLLHRLNEKSSIDVTLEGMVILVKLLQF